MGAINSPVLIPNLTIGNYVFTNPNTLKILIAPSEAAASSSRSTLRTANGTSGYQVTTGKTLYIRAVRLISTAGVFSPFLCYSDNDVGIAGATAFTNPVWFAALSPSSDPIWFSTQSGGGQVQEIAVNWPIPQGKYVSLDSNSAVTAGSVQVFGEEI